MGEHQDLSQRQAYTLNSLASVVNVVVIVGSVWSELDLDSKDLHFSSIVELLR